MRVIKRILVSLAAAAALWGGSLAAAGLGDLRIMTEQYPPYNFEQNGELRGIAVELLLAAADAAGQPLSKSEIDVLPWARGYRTVQKKSETMLFSMTRTEERDPLFKWVGPIADTRIALVARKDANVEIGSEAEIADYRIAVVRDDIGEQLLREVGVGDSSLDISVDPESAMKKLKAGRVDLWAYEENVAKWLINQSGDDFANYEAVHVLSESQLYYAFHKDTPKSVIEGFRDALDSVPADKVEAIKSHY